MKIVIDTSIYIDYLRSGKGLYSSLVDMRKRQVATLYTPSIVISELWAGESMSGLEENNHVKQMIAPTKIVDLTKQLAEKTGNLIRNNLVDETEDAIVAATAIELDAELATSNIKHFEKVKGLRLFSGSL